MKMNQTKKTTLKITMATLAVLTGAASVATLANTNSVFAETTKKSDVASLIDGSTVWKYEDTSVDQGTPENRYAWIAQDFNDANWKSSAGKFGHKNGQLIDLGGDNIPTVLLQHYSNGVSGDVVPTYFFRTTVKVETLDELASITGSLAYDDAAIVYINGTKVASFDEPSGGYETNMSYGGSNSSAPKTGDITISASTLKDVLKVGDNTIAVEIHQGRASSSDVYFEFKDLQVNYGEVKLEQKAINLTVGKDETEMNLTWYANSQSGEVQYAKASDMVNGEFPKTYSKVTAQSKLSNDALFNYHQATIPNLQENTQYVYRLINENTISENYKFTSADFDGKFNFVFAGDPQIGASGNAGNDTINWGKTLEDSVKKFDPNFIMSAGDQVNSASSENEYSGYLGHEELASVPQSPSIGNHDSGSSSYSQHFNLPNASEQGKTNAGGDYYYVYNNTLFLNINTNNTSIAEHKDFIKKAIEDNSDVRWKVVTFHQSIYSVASHAVETGILNLRNNLVPVFDELGIDVVLMGHDHVYVRSHIMKDLKVVTDTSALSQVTDPEGILYLTANSASGSKYYNIQNSINMDFVAKKDQSKQRSISNIEVSDNEFKVTTYLYNQTDDSWSQLDEFSVLKSVQTNEEETTLKPSDGSSTDVSIQAPKGSIVVGSTLSAEMITSGTLFEQVQSLMNKKDFKILDLSLIKNDQETDLLGNVQINFALPEGYDSNKVVVYKIKETMTRSTDVALEKVNATIKDGVVSITTAQLGQFVLMNNVEEQVPDQGGNDTVLPDQDASDKTPDQGTTDKTPSLNPDNKDQSQTQDKVTQTGDSSEILAYGIIGVAAASFAYVMKRKKTEE